MYSKIKEIRTLEQLGTVYIENVHSGVENVMATELNPVDKWKSIPWRKLRKIVFRLQVRIFKAQKNGNVLLVRKLQKLLLSSLCSEIACPKASDTVKYWTENRRGGRKESPRTLTKTGTI